MLISKASNQTMGAMAMSGMKQDHSAYQPMAHMVALCLPTFRDSLNHSGMAMIWEMK